MTTEFRHASWQATKWGNLATLEYGKSLRDYEPEQSVDKPYRVFGTNGPIGWHSSPLYAKPSIVVGRKGAYRGIHFSHDPFFVIDTAFYLKPTAEFDIRWAYYQLKNFDINKLDSGSAIPSTSRDAFYEIPVALPPLPVQQRIAGILSAYDDLIENSQRRIKILESMARTLYREWFVQAPEVLNWPQKTLGDLITLKRGYDLPERLRRPGSVPIVSSSGVTGYHDESKAAGPGLVTGRYGTLGEVHLVWDDFWPLNTSLYVVDYHDTPLLYAYWLLQEILKGQSGSAAAVPGLNRNHLHQLPFSAPPREKEQRFHSIVTPLAAQSSALQRQIQNLRRTRDLLLPRLLSGQIDVEPLDQ